MKRRYIAPHLRVIEFHAGGLCEPTIDTGDDNERQPQTAPKLGLDYFGSHNYWSDYEEEQQQ